MDQDHERADEQETARGRDPTEHRSSWAWTAVVMALVYVLSPVPIVWICERFDLGEQKWMEIVYAPLVIAYENVPAVEKFYDVLFDLGDGK